MPQVFRFQPNDRQLPRRIYGTDQGQDSPEGMEGQIH